MEEDCAVIRLPMRHRIETTPIGQLHVFYNDQEGELALSQNALEMSSDGILLHTFNQPITVNFGASLNCDAQSRRSRFCESRSEVRDEFSNITKNLKQHRFKTLRTCQCLKELLVDCYRCNFLISDKFVLDEGFDVSFMVDKKYKQINQELSNQRKDFNIQQKILIYAVFDVCSEIMQFISYQTQFCDIIAFFLFQTIENSDKPFEYQEVVQKTKKTVLSFLYNNRRLLDHFSNVVRMQCSVYKEFKKRIAALQKNLDVNADQAQAQKQGEQKDQDSEARISVSQKMQFMDLPVDKLLIRIERVKAILEDKNSRTVVTNKVFQLVSQFFTRYLNPRLTLQCLRRIMQFSPLQRAQEMLSLAVRILLHRMLSSDDGECECACLAQERLIASLDDLQGVGAEHIIEGV